MASQYWQDPAATLDYVIDWTAWLNGDTLSTSAWTVTADLSSSSSTFTSTSATTFLSGGTVGNTYYVRNKITTAQGRTEVETFTVTIRAH